MHVTKKLDEHSWRAFVNNQPQGNIFHIPEMARVFACAKKHKPSLWAVVDNKDQPIALLSSVNVTLLNGLFRHFTTRAIAYGGVMCSPGKKGQEALNLLLRVYNEEVRSRFLFTELRNLTEVNLFQSILINNNFNFEGHLNYLIELDRPEKDLWSRISKTGQQRIRSAYKKGIVVNEIRERNEIVKVYSLLRTVYSQVQVPLADITLFEAAYDILAPLGMFKIFYARLDEQYIGARFLLMYKGRIIDWYAGADRNYSTYSPNELLVWHTMKWGRENQFNIFDFGGAGKPEEEYGPRKFKAKFGGNLVNFGRYTRIHAPIKLKLSKTGYKFIRRYL